MSATAVQYVRACTHPTVRGGTRDLFLAIAHLVPDGQTTTPAVSMDVLAIEARRHRRTVVKRLADLVAIGAVDVIEGGVGRIARYTIVGLDGAAPIVAQPLPLRADLQPVRRLAAVDDTTGDLFAPDPVVRSDGEKAVLFDHRLAGEPVLIDHRLLPNLWRLITGWFLYASNLWRLITGWRSDGEKAVLFDHRLAAADAVLTTARDVHTFKNTHTDAAPRDGPSTPTAVPSPPCRFVGTVHAWCEGRVHVPMVLHREFGRKFGRLHGETDADVEAALRGFYASTCAHLRPDAVISENDFDFWRPRFAATFGSTTATQARAPHAIQRRRDIANSRPCPHAPPCAGDTDACVDRQMAEWRAAQQRKSG